MGIIVNCNFDSLAGTSKNTISPCIGATITYNLIVNCIPGMGQRGYWDEQQRVEKLKTKKPVLERLSESIPWESFRLLLE